MSNNPSALIIALIVILLLALIMRWVFRPSRPRQAVRPPDAADSLNLGLLTVVLTQLGRSDALARRAALSQANIRSSVSKRRDGTVDLLVFKTDVDRARHVLDA